MPIVHTIFEYHTDSDAPSMYDNYNPILEVRYRWEEKIVTLKIFENENDDDGSSPVVLKSKGVRDLAALLNEMANQLEKLEKETTKPELQRQTHP